MILDPQSTTSSKFYRFMIGVVVPRPIAFVSTVDREGRFNAAPFSFFNALSSAPPLIGIAINLRAGAPKDTLRNIREVSEFVVNVVSEPLAARMVQASGDWPKDVDEMALTGLTPIPSDLVRAPRIAESPIHLECRLHREVELGEGTLVIGEIVRAHAADEVLTDGLVDIEKLKPVGRLGGDGYSVVRDVIHLARPRIEPRAS